MLSPEELRQYDYFSGLSTNSLDALSKCLETVVLPAGSRIIRQGSPPDYFYFVRKGEVEVTKRTRFGQSATLKVLSTGEAFGEVAMLSCSHRTSSVTAETEVTLYRLNKKDFEDIVVQDAAFKNILHRKVEDYETYNRMKTFQPLAHLEPAKMLTLAEKLDERTCGPGEDIITQGEKGDFYYIIRSGTVEVVKEKEGRVAVLGEGESFGEEAIIRDQGRNATVRTLTKTTVLALSKAEFIKIMQASFLDFTFPEEIPLDETGKYVFIDARVPPEYEEEHIEGAVNIPIEVLRQKYPELDPAQEYLTYCTNDSRGMAAAFLLSTQGFKARNLRGGLSAWDGPVATGSDGIYMPKASP